jgi:hypothetical protein
MVGVRHCAGCFQKLFVDLDAQYIGRRGLVSGGSTGSVVVNDPVQQELCAQS